MEKGQWRSWAHGRHLKMQKRDGFKSGSRRKMTGAL